MMKKKNLRGSVADLELDGNGSDDKTDDNAGDGGGQE
jgi:hypothetical protein